MGIFDFFKKKKSVESNASDNKKEGAENNTTNKEVSGSIKITYSDLTEKDEITYYNGEKFNGVALGKGIGLATQPRFVNGDVIHLETKIPGESKKEYKDGILIKKMQYFSDGSLESFTNSEDGYEDRGWKKVNEDGQNDENGKRILVFERKDGRHTVYYNNGNKKSEKDVKDRLDAIPKPDEDKTYTEISYFENGNLSEKAVITKYSSDGNHPPGYMGGKNVEYKSFYYSGQILEEKVQDKVLAEKNIRYYENGSVLSIYASYTQTLYNSSGLKFYFDEKGNETSERDEKELELDSSLRKDLNLGTKGLVPEEFKGKINIEEVKDEREMLLHEIMTNGTFSFENKAGEYIRIYGQCHSLISKTQIWNEVFEEWEDQENCIEDRFYLTDYQKGYRFSEEDLCEFYEIEDPEWDYNGFSTDWCGIVEEDDSNERQKKWDDYTQKFPKVSSTDQFNTED